MAKIDLRPATRLQPLVRAKVAAPVQRRSKGSRRYTRLNAITGRFLVLLVLISAIPVASNRPSWWLIWTFILGIAALAYILRAQSLMGAKRQLQVSGFRAFIGLALAVPAYAVFQYIPVASYIPLSLQALPPLPSDLMRPDSLSVMPGASLLGAVRAVGFLVFLLLVLEVGTNALRVQKTGIWLMLGILCHGLFGLISLRLLDDYSLWGVKDVYQGMLTGTFVNRNSIATFLGFGLVLGVAFALTRAHEASQLEPDRGYKTFLTPRRLNLLGIWFVVVVLATCIMLTQSRMGLAATGTGAFVTFVALRLKFRTSPKRILLETVIGVLVLLAGLLPLAGTGVIERTLFALVESSDRVSVYIQTWGMILNRPLTGFGYDAFAPAFEMYRADPLVADRYVDLAHNTYLTLWAEQGLIIGSIPMVLTGWAAVIIIRRLRRDEGDLAMNAAALGVIVVGATHSMVDFSLEMPANVYCFLLIVGLAMSRPRTGNDLAAEALDNGAIAAPAAKVRGAA